jgi:cation:H+ antiporter
MIWLQFALTALLVVLAAIQLATYGDVIAVRTGLGGLFIGTLLVAMATSLPELLTAVNAIQQGAPNLTAGDIFGSGMFNMLLLALVDLLHRQKRVLRLVAAVHALSGGLAVLLTGLAVFFIWADIDLQIGWMGVDSLILMALYLYGLRLINRNARRAGASLPPEEELPKTAPPLWVAGLGFLLATLVLVLTTPWLVHSAIGIAEITGLSTGFVGAALVAVVTSLPEAASTLAAVRIGAYDLAVGNLFGSNLFNMFALGLIDFFYTDGRLLSVIDPNLTLAGLMALLLTSIALIGNLAQEERRFLFLEIDAWLILIGYGSGIYLLFSRGLLH